MSVMGEFEAGFAQLTGRQGQVLIIDTGLAPGQRAGTAVLAQMGWHEPPWGRSHHALTRIRWSAWAWH
jgi:hypothetical protein